MKQTHIVKTNTVAIFLVCLLFTAIAATMIRPVHAIPAMKVINPATGTSDFTFHSSEISMGQTFTVNITIADVANLRSWQMTLNYSSTILKCTRGWLPSDHVFSPVKDLGGMVIPENGMWNINDPDYPNQVVGGCTFVLPSGDWSFAGAGTLCQIEFEIISIPTSGSVSCDLIFFNPGTAENTDTFIAKQNPSPPPELVKMEFGTVNGHYECIGTGLPLPKLKVGSYTASSFGETFDINVTVSGLDAAHQLVNATLKLQGYSGVITVLNVTEGDFLGQFGSTTFQESHSEPNYVSMNMSVTPDPSTNFPTGGGTLATITFNATKHVPASCTLELSDADTKLINSTVGTISRNLASGNYMLFERVTHPIVWEDVTYYVKTYSNVSVSNAIFNQTAKKITFDVTGEGRGFINITIPAKLLWAEPTLNWTIMVDSTQIDLATPGTGNGVSSNQTQTLGAWVIQYYFVWFYFSLGSTETLSIIGTHVIPEFPTSIILPLFLVITLLAAALGKVQLIKRRKLVNTR